MLHQTVLTDTPHSAALWLIATKSCTSAAADCALYTVHRAMYNAVLKCTVTHCAQSNSHSAAPWSTTLQQTGWLVNCSGPPCTAVHSVHRHLTPCTYPYAAPAPAPCTAQNSTAKHIIALKHYSYRTLAHSCAPVTYSKETRKSAGHAKYGRHCTAPLHLAHLTKG